MKPASFLLAAALCSAAMAQDGVLMNGTAEQNGVAFTYETRLEPPTPSFMGGFVGGVVTDPAGIHRYMAYRSQHKFFGYDLQMDRRLMTDLVLRPGQTVDYRLVFRPLTIDPARVELEDPASWTTVPLLTFPSPQTVRGGDTIAIDLFTNPTTGQKIVDYLHFQRRNQTVKSYKIVQGDTLFITVPHPPGITGPKEVGADGYISVPLAGPIKASGLTPEQLSAQIADRLSRDSIRPEVNVQVVQVRSGKFYISGEVRNPGTYPLNTPITVYEAINAAGGPAEFSKSKKIYVLRGTQKLPFNYIDVSHGLHLEQNIQLQNGDVVVVP